MKTLFILRHAEAAPDNGGGDLGRRLTEKGFEDARALGRSMKEKNYAPDFIMCSAAERTKETLQGVSEFIKTPATAYDKKVYHASRGDLLEIIKGFNDKHDSAMIVGHNPAVHELAASLAADEPAENLEKLARGYPPGTLAVFSCPRARWEDIQPGENRLDAILIGH